MVTGRLAPVLLFVSTNVFPFVSLPLLAWAWWHVSSGNTAFVVFVLGVPLVFGYVMPGVATNFVRRWRFTSGWRVGEYYVHHGLIYSTKMNLVLILAMHDLRAIDGAFRTTAVIVLTGAATAFGGWWHDLHAVRNGKIELVGADGVDPERALATFAPGSYFAIGATFAAISIVAWRVLSTNAGALWWVFGAGLVGLCLVPSLVFLTLDPRAASTIVRKFHRESRT